MDIVVFDVDPINKDLAGFGFVESLEEGEDGRFSAAWGTDKCDFLAERDLHAEIIEQILRSRFILEFYVSQLDLAIDRTPQEFRIFLNLYLILIFGIQKNEQIGSRHLALGNIGQHMRSIASGKRRKEHGKDSRKHILNGYPIVTNKNRAHIETDSNNKEHNKLSNSIKEAWNNATLHRVMGRPFQYFFVIPQNDIFVA